MISHSDLLEVFYTTSRAGAELLSDGGGPFGFDIQVALQIDYLIKSYQVKRIVETGCCLGDTTEYLGRRYPDLQIDTCDIDPNYASFTRMRTASLSNVQVHTGDSGELIPKLMRSGDVTLLYLDAHWGDRWPLESELNLITSGIVAVDDFNINHPRFGYDSYGGVECGVDALRLYLPALTRMFIGNPLAKYSYPCLQVGRRTGTCYIPIATDDEPLLRSSQFREVSLASREPISWS